MKRLLIVFALVGVVLLLWTFAKRTGGRSSDPEPRVTSTTSAEAPMASEGTQDGVLYGRVSTGDGAIYEGRLRFGGDEEALWNHYFNGTKGQNDWSPYVSPQQLPRSLQPTSVFGITLFEREVMESLARPFMARLGDIAVIEASGKDVRVTLKSGSEFNLDRFAASDFDDGLRVWDRRHGVVDLDSLQIRRVELFAPDHPVTSSEPLYGTVRTTGGEFTGLLQWNRQQSLGSDELQGKTAEGELGVRFEAIQSIVRQSEVASLVTQTDGSQVVLSGTSAVGSGNRGIYVDDARFGRVLVSWKAFERLDVGSGGTGPGYGDFPPGRPLSGRVTTRQGDQFVGRVVYDLDESETTETLDAPSEGVDYTLPLGLIASIVVWEDGEPEDERVGVTLHSGEALRLERLGDLGEGNAGLLVFSLGTEHPTYVPWAEVARIDLDRPAAVYRPASSP